MAKPKWKIIYEHLQRGYTLRLTPSGKYALVSPQGGIASPDVPRASVNALEDRNLLVATVWSAVEVTSAPAPLKGVVVNVSAKNRTVDMKEKQRNSRLSFL